MRDFQHLSERKSFVILGFLEVNDKAASSSERARPSNAVGKLSPVKRQCSDRTVAPSRFTDSDYWAFVFAFCWSPTASRRAWCRDRDRPSLRSASHVRPG